MGILYYILLGLSLSMDALAVSVSTGICVPDMKNKDALRMALYFGGFQALMPFIGWLLGSSVASYIQELDHWIAFGLLAIIGIKMILDARKTGEEECPTDLLSHRTLFPMAIATSIDALAVGITLGLVEASIGLASGIIGPVTFVLSFVGAKFGCQLGERFEKGAMIVGGVVLVAIGTKILIEHLVYGI